MENIGFIYAIGAAITWGMVYTIDQKILINISPLNLLLINAILSIIIILPFAVTEKEQIKELFLSKHTTVMLILISTTLAILANFLIFSGIKKLGASSASVIEITYPFFIVIFSFIFFRSVPNPHFFIGTAMIFIGSIIIMRFS